MKKQKMNPQPPGEAIRYKWIINWESESMHAEFVDAVGNDVFTAFPPWDTSQDMRAEPIDGIWFWFAAE
jgi:hypothetical protein